MEIKTKVILSTQFSNMWEGPKPASLTYEVTYAGNDKQYQETYDKEENLTEEIARQVDFWGCVTGYNECYNVEVKVCDDITDKEVIEKHLTGLILEDMKIKTGKRPEESFLDKMSDKEKKDIEEGVARVKRQFPGMFK